MVKNGGFHKWLQLKQYQLELTYSVYMFTPWEKFAFYSIFFLLFSLTFIAATLYLPHHIAFLVDRAWYYINGESIDIASAAREVAKEVSAGVLQDVAATTGRVLAENAEGVLREL